MNRILVINMILSKHKQLAKVINAKRRRLFNRQLKEQKEAINEILNSTKNFTLGLTDNPIFVADTSLIYSETFNQPTPNEEVKYINKHKMCKKEAVYNILRDFGIIHLDSQKTFDTFFAQKALMMYIHNTPRIEMDKCIEFVREMIELKGERQRKIHKLIARSSPIRNKRVLDVTDNRSLSCEKRRPIKRNWHISLLSNEKIESKCKLNVDDFYTRQISCLRNERSFSPLKFPEITLSRSEVDKFFIKRIISACNKMNNSFIKTIRRATKINKLLNKDISDIILKFEGKETDKVAEAELKRLVNKENKRKRCFIYGRKGKGQFLSTTSQ